MRAARAPRARAPFVDEVIDQRPPDLVRLRGAPTDQLRRSATELRRDFGHRTEGRRPRRPRARARRCPLRARRPATHEAPAALAHARANHPPPPTGSHRRHGCAMLAHKRRRAATVVRPAGSAGRSVWAVASLVSSVSRGARRDCPSARASLRLSATSEPRGSLSGEPCQPVCQQSMTRGTWATTGSDQTARSKLVESALLNSAASQWVPGAM